MYAIIDEVTDVNEPLGRRYVLKLDGGRLEAYELGRDVAIHQMGGGVHSLYVPQGTKLHVEVCK